MNIKYPVIKSMDDLETTIAKALESVNTMKKKVQIAAVSCVYMATKCEGDEQAKLISIVNKMVVDLGDGIRSKGLIAFFETYGFNLADDVSEGFESVKAKDKIEESYQEARATHWYTLSPEAVFKDYDFKDALRKLVKQAKAKNKDVEHADQITVDMDILAVVDALLSGQDVKAEGALKLVDKLAA